MARLVNTQAILGTAWITLKYAHTHTHTHTHTHMINNNDNINIFFLGRELRFFGL